MSCLREAGDARVWSRVELLELFDLPFADLVFRAQTTHRLHFNANEVQVSTLLSVKTGGCAENCGYCSQSAHFKTGLRASKLIELDAVIEQAQIARESGAQRFCMGAAWSNPKERDMDALCAMVGEVKGLGLETCMTLGMLTPEQSGRLAQAGLDYYNHNLDSSPEFYERTVTTRTYQDRLDTLEHVRNSGIAVCTGGIIGMGESREDRAGLIETLTTLSPPPESVPINALVPIAGTPMGDAILSGEAEGVDGIEFVRTIAVARIALPTSVIRLSAGREAMSDELQALCFLAGAGSIFAGERLLTTSNNSVAADRALFSKLGIEPSRRADTDDFRSVSHQAAV